MSVIVKMQFECPQCYADARHGRQHETYVPHATDVPGATFVVTLEVPVADPDDDPTDFLPPTVSCPRDHVVDAHEHWIGDVP